ncbi:hypothetical protein B0T22DRAFT_486973 [Podospora appendiculata]|uniref:Uncharacterized protein n=1 Tax=Podospora appendiculata TaxID=314037 RepID=A0AAE1CGA3_9PEZI|nr:hypothetical protein B0T22DRAFT_486973 [Podospora appendiculata]
MTRRSMIILALLKHLRQRHRTSQPRIFKVYSNNQSSFLDLSRRQCLVSSYHQPSQRHRPLTSQLRNLKVYSNNQTSSMDPDSRQSPIAPHHQPSQHHRLLPPQYWRSQRTKRQQHQGRLLSPSRTEQTTDAGAHPQTSETAGFGSREGATMWSIEGRERPTSFFMGHLDREDAATKAREENIMKEKIAAVRAKYPEGGPLRPLPREPRQRSKKAADQPAAPAHHAAAMDQDMEFNPPATAEPAGAPEYPDPAMGQNMGFNQNVDINENMDYNPQAAAHLAAGLQAPAYGYTHGTGQYMNFNNFPAAGPPTQFPHHLPQFPSQSQTQLPYIDMHMSPTKLQEIDREHALWKMQQAAQQSQEAQYRREFRHQGP